jgi:flagellar protein FlaI
MKKKNKHLKHVHTSKHVVSKHLQHHHAHMHQHHQPIVPAVHEIKTLAKVPEHKAVEHKAHKTEVKSEQIIDQYKLGTDQTSVLITIKKDERGLTYNVHIPGINIATSALLAEIRNELVTTTTVSMKELTDPEAFAQIKDRFTKEAVKLLKSRLPHIEQPTQDFLVSKLMQDMLGLGEIEFLISDPALEEIVIPCAREAVRVYTKKYGWLSTNIAIKTEEEIVNYSNIIARRVGRQITVLNPLLDAHLVTGDRINAVLYPINTKGTTITIRKFARDPYTIIDLIANKTCDLDTSALLWLAIEYEMNVLVSGGTASGKTSFLNACLPFIPPSNRILSIEDTRELMLPDFLYWTPLVTRTPNPEGKGEVSMLDLLVNSLRMRPDRIILGEMRRHEEAMVLFEAMHTGHSVYATVHADSAAETISRLVNPPINVPANLLKAVNLNVVMFRDRRRGIRRISQIAEFEADNNEARAQVLYRWSPEEDKMIKHSESSRFFEDINRHTGMSDTDIKKDLSEKRKILSWLLDNKIRSLTEFGNIMNHYYRDKEGLLRAVDKNDKKNPRLR